MQVEYQRINIGHDGYCSDEDEEEMHEHQELYKDEIEEFDIPIELFGNDHKNQVIFTYDVPISFIEPKEYYLDTKPFDKDINTLEKQTMGIRKIIEKTKEKHNHGESYCSREGNFIMVSKIKFKEPFTVDKQREILNYKLERLLIQVQKFEDEIFFYKTRIQQIEEHKTIDDERRLYGSKIPEPVYRPFPEFSFKKDIKTLIEKIKKETENIKDLKNRKQELLYYYRNRLSQKFNRTLNCIGCKKEITYTYDQLMKQRVHSQVCSKKCDKECNKNISWRQKFVAS